MPIVNLLELYPAAEQESYPEREQVAIARRREGIEAGKVPPEAADLPMWEIVAAGLYDTYQSRWVWTTSEIHTHHPENPSLPTPESIYTTPPPPKKRGRKRVPTPYDNLPPAERNKAKMRDYMRIYRANHKKPKD
jgi:hypothetical protein